MDMRQCDQLTGLRSDWGSPSEKTGLYPLKDSSRSTQAALKPLVIATVQKPLLPGLRP
jgi:hypothetical protein